MRRSLLCSLLTLVLCMGCSSPLTVVYVGEPDMNNGGNAAVVKVYQLSGDGNFRSAPLSAFWRDEQETLGNELVAAPRKVTLYPAKTRTLEFDLADKTQYVGIAANLREPDREQWRSLHSVDEMGDQVSVTVEEDRISVEVEERTLPSLSLDVL